jgi:hypothetical protein
MEFLNESALSEASRVILNDVSIKLFDLLCIRILREEWQILFQLLSVLSPVDVIKKRNAQSDSVVAAEALADFWN